MKRILNGSLLATAFLSASVLAKNNIELVYLEPNSEDEKAVKSLLVSSGVNELVVGFGENLFPFDKPLTIEYGSDDGPLFDPESNIVQMPYFFVSEAQNYFAKNSYEKKYGKTAEQGAIDTVLHTLLHELGHAYIADKQIPVLGKEEDAVDNLATIVMIEYVENGADAAISAADMFDFETEGQPDHYQLVEYAGEHSFNLQRYFQTLCLVYGSDPEKFAGLLDEIGKDYREEREGYCEYNYNTISTNWHTYLGELRNK
ncbi:DUF4344 domain-containing metallopeptidase [Vibrio nigripulchritudo]|uniref:DUF4344 domain-containing metallopeptidase n=1 Tax=Vibrio nigripulchritudo TaxID=28173 RepID=UPI002490974F|nr:DUF4344 domain-containing metallopeptidase [Vibrio nigripulchritudo]BDU40545.1 hypothetical protein TUMSATVNIG2_50140 [Vibrio nigripulchritudo]BDU46282.1 hypothetical protein TUMSATVNIG3_50800 [Vibrio nigripulchritudo]